MGESENLKGRVDGSGDLAKDVTKAAKLLHDEATAAGRTPVGGFRATVSKNGLVTVSSRTVDAEETAVTVTGVPSPTRVRHNVDDGPTVKDVNGALKSLREKAHNDGQTLVGPPKVTFTTTAAGARYLTASAKTAQLGGLLAAAHRVAANGAAPDREAMKALQTEVKTALKSV